MLILEDPSKGNKMMQQWFAVSLGDALLAQTKLSMLEQYLSDCYEQAEKPPNMSALYRHESTGVHCHVSVFLTASLQQRAKLDNAVLCYRINAENMSYLAGYNVLVKMDF